MKQYTDEQLELATLRLSKVNGFKREGQTKVTEIRQYPDGEFVLLCADELSMYRIARHFRVSRSRYGWSENLQSFYVFSQTIE